MLVILLVATLVAVDRTASSSSPPAVAGDDDEVVAAAPRLGARLIATIAGPDSINDTAERWNVHGADLGHTFESDDDLYMVFGDTWGAGGVEGHDWRSNSMARIADWEPGDDLEFAEMIAGPDGHAAELLGSQKVDGVEKTVIPTQGIAIDGRMYLHYMSVRTWIRPGHWDVGHSGLATSDDGGHTWTKHEQARWPGTSHFAQVAMTRHEGMVYLLGIPAGRFGGVAVARTGEDAMLDLDAYEYFDGSDWVRGRPEAAVTVLDGPVGELSVRWSEHHQRWLMMYLDEAKEAIVLRMASDLTGPWQDEQIVVTAKEYPHLYAPYLLPFADDSDTIAFTMSVFEPYAVLMLSTEVAVPVLEAQGADESLDDESLLPDDSAETPDDGATEPEVGE